TSLPLDQIDGGPYESVLPAAGSFLPAVQSYELCGARFRFAGATGVDVERGIQRTAADFALHCVPGDVPALVHAVEGELE
ncbi:hypothetical protein AB0B25_32040, partial [Nocardia sp. NPDC049190]|uniref:hypothetical protein n=1 Tax=Nocardia sp. NPDC049190 TaxID=3155650 RepID=UPI0033F4182C